MKVIHMPFGYFPDPVGGTETYVRSLVRELRTCGVTSTIAAPAQENAHYVIDETEVIRYKTSLQYSDLRYLYGEGDPKAEKEFVTILEDQRPDLLHVHAFTSAVSLQIVQAAKKCGIPVIFTYHTPTVTCQRGTLMHWGNLVCDGHLSVQRCTACTLHGKGMSHSASRILSGIPPSVGQIVGQMGLQGGPWTALRMSELVALRHASIRQLLHKVDHIIAVCDWIQALLILNDVPADKITVSRHGIAHQKNGYKKIKRCDNECGLIKMVFLGRLDPTKGIDMVLKALQALPEAPLQFDIYGIAQPGSEAYVQSLQQCIACDLRIRLMQPVPEEQILELLASYDFLVVPSQLLETGPLVVLEAFAAGIPVIGSRLGGIAEWIQHGVNGLLVEAASEKAWVQTLKALIDQPALMTQLAKNVGQPRSIQQVASEMLALYKKYIRVNQNIELIQDNYCNA